MDLLWLYGCMLFTGEQLLVSNTQAEDPFQWYQA